MESPKPKLQQTSLPLASDRLAKLDPRSRLEAIRAVAHLLLSAAGWRRSAREVGHDED